MRSSWREMMLRFRFAWYALRGRAVMRKVDVVGGAIFPDGPFLIDGCSFKGTGR